MHHKKGSDLVLKWVALRRQEHPNT